MAVNGAEAAFASGRAALGGGDGGEVERCFELAVRLGGPVYLWRAAGAFNDAFDGRAADWQRRAVASLSVPDGIVVDPDTLPIVVSQGYPVDQVWRLAVRHGDGPRTLAALTAARERLYRVTEDGRELGEAEFREFCQAPDCYTPNGVTLRPDSLELSLNCKDAVMPLMAAAVLRVVVEELTAHGVGTAGLFTPPAARRSHWGGSATACQR
ncbi:hypothetical protein ACFV4F_01795 [Kitasatospora sp. NPDC059722]|uniref:hypothetical protein n=1 Tax=Kitasatospora sp. NPDC059722 TaxID=3346925 RepID=UPI003680FB7F